MILSFDAFDFTKLRFHYERKLFHFKQPSGTSRGILTEKHAWFLRIWKADDESVVGTGECSIIPGLSPDFESFSSYEAEIQMLCMRANTGQFSAYEELYNSIQQFPSVVFGVETALQDLQQGGRGIFFETDFTAGKRAIPINGLIWMGDEAFMQSQIDEKLALGYTCIKMKIGAIEFAKELAILRNLRMRFPASELTLRVDANGAFSSAEAMGKLALLADLDIHSIEQPLAAGDWQAMATLCSKTPLPIALDEELIGVQGSEKKKALITTIQPQFIILKPSLHGGISGCEEWISIATAAGIPWWITSALESNVGLNAIAQFTATYDNPLPQGLGTGGLYVENTPTKLHISQGNLHFG